MIVRKNQIVKADTLTAAVIKAYAEKTAYLVRTNGEIRLLTDIYLSIRVELRSIC